MTDNRTYGVKKAVLDRRSVRSFLSRPVPDTILKDILTTALSAPSGGNLQPWRIHAVTGQKLDALRNEIAGKVANGETEDAAHAVYPASLWEPYRTRRFANGEALYNTIGIPREDKPARLRQLAQNYQFFGAPVGLFFTIEAKMERAQWVDIGIIIQTIMLLAVDNGLATCPQAAWANWPETIGRLLDMPDGTIVVAGMALGYEDTDHPINTLRTERQALEEAVIFHGD